MAQNGRGRDGILDGVATVVVDAVDDKLLLSRGEKGGFLGEVDDYEAGDDSDGDGNGAFNDENP